MTGWHVHRRRQKKEGTCVEVCGVRSIGRDLNRRGTDAVEAGLGRRLAGEGRGGQTCVALSPNSAVAAAVGAARTTAVGRSLGQRLVRGLKTPRPQRRLQRDNCWAERDAGRFSSCPGPPERRPNAVAAVVVVALRPRRRPLKRPRLRDQRVRGWANGAAQVWEGAGLEMEAWCPGAAAQVEGTESRRAVVEEVEEISRRAPRWSATQSAGGRERWGTAWWLG